MELNLFLSPFHYCPSYTHRQLASNFIGLSLNPGPKNMGAEKEERGGSGENDFFCCCVFQQSVDQYSNVQFVLHSLWVSENPLDASLGRMTSPAKWSHSQ